MAYSSRVRASRTAKLTFALLVLLVTCLTTGQAISTASVSPVVGTSVDPDVAFVMSRDGVSAAEANERLQRQDLAGPLETEARTALGEHYAGVWTDIDRDMVTVASTEGTQDLSSLPSWRSLQGHIEKVTVANSVAELYAAQENLIALTRDSEIYAVDGVDLQKNAVDVQALPGARLQAVNPSDAAAEEYMTHAAL